LELHSPPDNRMTEHFITSSVSPVCSNAFLMFWGFVVDLMWANRVRFLVGCSSLGRGTRIQSFLARLTDYPTTRKLSRYVSPQQ
jgi:hypothetical protein